MCDILVIDDNEIVRETVRRVLAVSGHRVETAPDGLAGIEKFASAPFDVVICDMFMPGEDGIGTIRAIREQNREVGIIAVSGSGADGGYNVLSMSASLGADVTLAKPFANADLLAAVARVAAPRPPDAA
jgi:two-component system, chemotaxis family, chemotaxis protein CheY